MQWWSDYVNIPAEPGFHMVTGGTDADLEKAFYEWQNLGQVCEHRVNLEASAGEQRASDESFRRCQLYLPEVPTCTTYEHYETPLTHEQEQESEACLELTLPFFEALAEGKIDHIGPPLWKYIRTEGDMDHPVTIELGTTYWDWDLPSYLE